MGRLMKRSDISCAGFMLLLSMAGVTECRGPLGLLIYVGAVVLAIALVALGERG